jgi:hypothetical protein
MSLDEPMPMTFHHERQPERRIRLTHGQRDGDQPADVPEADVIRWLKEDGLGRHAGLAAVCASRADS